MSKIVNMFKNWYREFQMSPYERYLSQATDAADLEYRMQAVRRGIVKVYGNAYA